MNDIKILGKAQRHNSPLRDKPDDMSLSDWIKLREKQRQQLSTWHSKHVVIP
jgi:hypothetical protein